MVKLGLSAVLLAVTHGVAVGAAVGAFDAAKDDDGDLRKRHCQHKGNTHCHLPARDNAFEGIWKHGDDAAKQCAWLGQNFESKTSLKVNGTFAQYWPQGSNPSLQLLVSAYPDGTLPKKFKPHLLQTLLKTGPDIDIRSDHAYGKSAGPAGVNLNLHGPLGSLPAFCRLGGFISTSDVTSVFFETWMPLATDNTAPLAPPDPNDYPTDTTPVVVDGTGAIVKGPPSVIGHSDTALLEQLSQADAFELESKISMSQAIPGDEILSNPRDFDGWNGRLLWIGNGGQRGFPPLPDLKSALSRYRFAVAGSNAGHWSTTAATQWVLGPARVDAATDWAHRASHVGRQAALEAIDLFYGADLGVRVPDKPSATQFSKSRLRAYYLGCSVGGAQGLGALQTYPTDFDGVLAGAPTVYFNSLNHGQIHTQSRHRAEVVGKAIFNISTLTGPVQDLLLKQCDALDGVADGVITQAAQCQFDFGSLLCGSNSEYGQDPNTCLDEAQLANLKELYAPTIYNSTLIYPRYLPGLETAASKLSGNAGKAVGWINDAVLNNKTYKGFDPYLNETLEIWQKGEDLDLGGSNFDKVDVSDALNADIKILHYHGLADLTVSPLASIKYHEEVANAVQGKIGKPLANNYRFFAVPGMNHCRGGPGAWIFDCSTQREAGNVPASWDSRGDAILALAAWTELGDDHAPDYLISVAYNSKDVVVPDGSGSSKGSPTTFYSADFGVNYTRKLCPWPLLPYYSGQGASTGVAAWLSFECKQP